MASFSNRNLLSFEYEKSIPEILTKIQEKIVSVEAKIEERKIREEKIRKEYEITDEDLIRVLSQAANASGSNVQGSYTLSSTTHRVIGAGVVQNLLTERELREQEEASVHRLKLLQRNLAPISIWAETHWETKNVFRLSEADLEYLGF